MFATLTRLWLGCSCAAAETATKAWSLQWIWGYEDCADFHQEAIDNIDLDSHGHFGLSVGVSLQNCQSYQGA